MRFHPLAVSVALGALASNPMVDAFVLPKRASTSEASARHPTTGTGTSSTLVGLAAKNDGSQYTSLEENFFDSNGGGNKESSKYVNEGTENPSAPTKKLKKPNPRTEKFRAKLESDLAFAEETRVRAAQQLAEAESSRLALEAEAAKAAKEAEELESKFKAFEAKEAARAAAGGGGLGPAGIVGEIAGPLVGGFAAFGGLAAARDQLAVRSEKAEEDRLQREEEERRAEAAATKKAAQENQTQNLLPIVGAGVAGLGVFGAFFGSGGSGGGGGGDTVIDAMAKNNVGDAVSKQQPKVFSPMAAGSITTAVPDPSKVDLPYLDKAIAKAESKQKKEKPPKKLTKQQLARQADEEQRATEARLEQKLAEAPELARKAAEAEAKAAEEARIEAEKKALFEKEAAERKIAEEQALAEKKVLEAKQAADEAAAAAEKAKAEKIAAEKKAADEAAAAAEKAKAEKIAAEKKSAEEAAAAAEKAKVQKIAADKLAFEKIKAEQQKRDAEEQAKAKKIAEDKLAFEKLKAEQEEQKAREEEAANALRLLELQKSQSFIPKVPAVSEMLFGNNKPSMFTDKGLSTVFSPTTAIIGGVALAGAAAVAAVVAANESPAVSSTFKVTGKTPKEYLESEDNDVNKASTPKKTIRIPRPPEQNSQVSSEAPQQSQSPDVPETPPLPGSKEALREELAKQRANINRQAAEKEASNSPTGDTVSPPSPEINYSANDDTIVEKVDGVGPAFVPPSMKNSFSPFRGGKPKSAGNDSLYSPPVSEGSISDFSRNTSADEPMSAPAEMTDSERQNTEGTSFTTEPKKSYSPFGGGKPKAVSNDFLYSSPTSQPDDIAVTSPVGPMDPTPDQSTFESTPSAIEPKRSYSPFGGGKPKSAINDSLYSPPATGFAKTGFGTNEHLVSPIEAMPNQDMADEIPLASTTEENFAAFEEMNPETDFIDSPDYTLRNTSIEGTSFTPNSSTVTKKNYSPFSGGKPFVAVDNPLYGPPSSGNSEDSTSYDIPREDKPLTATEETSVNPETPDSPPQKISPFGGGKPIASYNDSLYSPPANESFDTSMYEEESPLPFSASGLDDTSSRTTPETTTFRAPGKKSYSPFGSKPKAPSDRTGNSGGYLDGL